MGNYVTVDKWAEENKQIRAENKKDRHALANKVQDMFLDVSSKMDVLIENVSDMKVLKNDIDHLKKSDEKQENDIQELKGFMYKIVWAVAIISFVVPYVVDKM